MRGVFSPTSAAYFLAMKLIAIASAANQSRNFAQRTHHVIRFSAERFKRCVGTIDPEHGEAKRFCTGGVPAIARHKTDTAGHEMKFSQRAQRAGRIFEQLQGAMGPIQFRQRRLGELEYFSVALRLLTGS